MRWTLADCLGVSKIALLPPPIVPTPTICPTLLIAVACVSVHPLPLESAKNRELLFLAGGSFFAGEQIVGLSPFVHSGMTGIGIPPPAMVMLVPTGFPGVTTRTTHSVASWAGNVAGLGLLEGAIFPVPANGGGPPGILEPHLRQQCIGGLHRVLYPEPNH